MITVAIVAGLAGFWLWNVLNDEDGIFRRVNRLLHKNEMTKKWLVCPWCSGAWFSIAGSVALHHDGVASTLVTAIAAAAVCGLVGSYVEGG